MSWSSLDDTRIAAKTRAVSRAEASAYLDKASEFLQAAQDSLGLRNYVAATGNAVHAGIAAADAISAAMVGSVWAGEHSVAARHVESTGPAGQKAAPQLRRLVALKNRAEYDPKPIPAADARAALEAAERLVQIAQRSISGTS
jgi:hypothetical protein